MTKSCTTCAHGGRPRANYPCNLCGLTMGRDEAIPSMYAEKEDPMTNADRIRAMSDEEFAVYIARNRVADMSFVASIYGTGLPNQEELVKTESRTILEWLQLPWEGKNDSD